MKTINDKLNVTSAEKDDALKDRIEALEAEIKELKDADGAEIDDKKMGSESKTTIDDMYNKVKDLI